MVCSTLIDSVHSALLFSGVQLGRWAPRSFDVDETLQKPPRNYSIFPWIQIALELQCSRAGNSHAMSFCLLEVCPGFLSRKKKIIQFKMRARDMEEDDSSHKINNASCRGLIRHVGKGHPFSSLDVGFRISRSLCALLAIEAPHQT